MNFKGFLSGLFLDNVCAQLGQIPKRMLAFIDICFISTTTIIYTSLDKGECQIAAC